MRVLGINSSFDLRSGDTAFGHDASAVLLHDGEIVAAAEEERFTRVKHTCAFPVNAIRYCLREGNIGFDSIDCIAINGNEDGIDFQIYLEYLNHPKMAWPGGAYSYLDQLFREYFGTGVASRLRFCDHHVAHAWSAFGCSGFDESLVVTLDGAGDNRSGTVFLGKDRTLALLADYNVPESLGMTYWFMTQLLGYRHFDEYKVMGLAPWGDPARFAPLFQSMYVLQEDGRYQFENALRVKRRLISSGLLDIARPVNGDFKGPPADIAAALQQTLEDISLHLIHHYQKFTGAKNLCLAGGVAHNCSMVGELIRKGHFGNVFVQPAAHDGGGALGAALWAFHEQGGRRVTQQLRHTYLGPDVGMKREINASLSRWEPLVSFSVADNISATAARLLADGHVIGWVQGRSEFGPRALGNRSILADPRPAANKERINAMIKKREAFRPFAPAVLQHRFSEYFDGFDQEVFPFMTAVVKVLERNHELLGAITHVDGTARVQTVERATNPLFFELLTEFEELTGIPILLNTSFNNHAEPIVQTVDDAVACFVTSGLDFLVIGKCVVSKPEPQRIQSLMSDFVPAIPRYLQFFRRSTGNARGQWQEEIGLETTATYRDQRRERVVSDEMFRILQLCDGSRTASDIYGEALSRPLAAELLELWTDRYVTVRPRVAKAPESEQVLAEARREPATAQY